MFVCTYCLATKQDDDRSEEHVVGAALGGTWTVSDVCSACQSRANDEIDRPFAQMLWTLENRHRHKVPDRYGRVPPAPFQDVVLDDGRKGRIELAREGGWRLEIFPSITEKPDGGFNLRASVDNEAEVMSKAKERFERANPGMTWAVESRVVEPHDPIQVTFPFQMSLTLWPRFAVKVALNVGRELWGETWLASDHGRLLHRLLWNEESTVKMKPLPTARVPGAGLSGYAPGADHILYVNTGPDGNPMLLISLFGEETYGVPLGPGLSLPERTVWLLHVHERGHEHISLDEYFRRIIISISATERGPRDLTERPPA